MGIITARLSVANTYTFGAPLRFNMQNNEGPVLFDLSVLALGTPDFEKIGVRVLDNVLPIYPGRGWADGSTSIDGSAAYGPIFPFASGLVLTNINAVLSGPPYSLAFEFYNIDAAAVIISIVARVGQKDENIVKVKNVLDIAAEVAKLLSESRVPESD